MKLVKCSRASVLVLAGMASLAAATGAFASGVLDGSTAQAPVEPVAPGPVAPDLQNAFVAFQRPQTTADAVSGQALNVVNSDQVYGINPAQSRLVVNTGGLQMWLVPGPETSCLVGNDGLGGCTPNAVAESRGFVGGIVGGSAPMWFGVMPSAVKRIGLTGASASEVSLNSDDGFDVESHGAGISFVPVGGSTAVEIAGTVPSTPVGGQSAPQQCPAGASWCN